MKTFAIDETSVSAYLYHKLLGHAVEPQTLRITPRAPWFWRGWGGGLSSPLFFEPPFCQPPVLAIAFFCGHEFHMPALPCVQPPPQGEGTLAKMGDRHRLGPGESKGKARSGNPGAGCVRPGKNLKRKRAARCRSPREICDESKSGFVATFDLSRLLPSCAGGTKGP